MLNLSVLALVHNLAIVFVLEHFFDRLIYMQVPAPIKFLKILFLGHSCGSEVHKVQYCYLWHLPAEMSSTVLTIN